MTFYEKYIGRNRDSFSSLEDARANYKISCPESFNFAYDVIDELGNTKPDKLAMLWVSRNDEEKRFTFKDMSLMSNKAANALKSLGIRKGDKVLLVLKRHYYFWVIMLALHKIGAVAIQATHMLMAKDYVYRCNSADVKMAIITGDGDCTERFDQNQQEYATLQIKATFGKNAEGWINFDECFNCASDEWSRPIGAEATKSTDTMLMAFTSGTTGYPKIIMHDFAYPLGHIVTGVFWHRVIDGGLHFTVADSGWAKALWGKFYGQWLGETALLVYDFDKFHGADILSKIEKYKVTTFCVPPTMYRLMLQEDITKYDLSCLQHCCSAGEALNAEIFNTWKAATGLEIHEGFGQSETSVCIGTLYPFERPTPGVIGRPTLGYGIKLLDESGKECPPGVIGEICINEKHGKVYGLFTGYYKDKEANRRCRYNGYYHTCDTAYMDSNGCFRYVGRNDDVIKSSGYRIGPFEVESVLLEHPAVLETAVTGIPDAVRGYNVKATIVLKSGYTPSPELISELQQFVKKNTAPYKYPRVIEFVDALPKTFSGKIRRGEIRKRDNLS